MLEKVITVKLSKNNETYFNRSGVLVRKDSRVGLSQKISHVRTQTELAITNPMKKNPVEARYYALILIFLYLVL